MKSRNKFTIGCQVPGGNFSRDLLRWYDRHQRKLPWRQSKPNPYRVWLSEIMLQQTQVDTVLPYYQRFLKTFPGVEKLACASVEKVLQLWSGLGYYSRARNLHQAAKIIAAKGGFPQTKEEWLELPGIGEYSAGAITSIAFGEKMPAVDGNVIRVLTRLFALKGNPQKNPLKKKLRELAASLVPAKRSGDFNQALMELGALVCLPKEPKCLQCPLKRACRAYLKNSVEDYSTPPKKKPMQKVFLQASLIRKNGAFLLAKRNEKRHLQSMWEFPQVKPKRLGLKVKLEDVLPVVRHSIMNRAIRLTPYLYCFEGGMPRPNSHYIAYRWIKPMELESFPTSSLNHKILKGVFYE